MGNSESYVLVAGSATEDAVKHGDAVSKSCNIPPGSKGNMEGGCIDVRKVEANVLRASEADPLGSCTVVAFADAGTRTRKADVLRAIQEAMNSKDAVTIYYSGHGRQLTGDWCFENASGTVTEYITFDEVVGLWKSSTWKLSLPRGFRSLSIIMDSCYSGAWVKKVESLPDGMNVRLKASCGRLETSWDTANGGAFTKALFEHESPWHMSVLPSAKEVKMCGALDTQTPCASRDIIDYSSRFWRTGTWRPDKE